MNVMDDTATSRRPAAAVRTRQAAACLLLLSAVTHVLQVPVYGTEGNVLGAAAFGVIYAVLGTGLLRNWRWTIPASVVLPVIGGTLGILRFAFLHSNPFSIWHVALDLAIVPLAIITHHKTRKPPTTP
ncbi:hypothetical protein [Actinomadura rupiterrae]|uniref:hypothetical protein n=1 Tax=Actinomadura rupiterrae TaxID=559627 RepID=UPI0020A35901|nr:hypothetical protein [Actinomadura rupiterrae]MCP2342089.1 membrane associated rhomboid family serine protease [Actinomadura rupiterrae]